MANIKDLEMAAAVSAVPHIEIRKSFFGLRQNAVYTPTSSPMTVLIQEYAPAEGERLQKLLRMQPDKLAAALSGGKPASTPVGHFRLEALVSADQQAVALQLFTFTDFSYTPAIDFLFYEGDDAQAVLKAI